MLSKTELYKKYVLEDIKNHNVLFHPVKAPIYERIKAKMVDPKILHPNPEDEFAMENIGPNWEIEGNYEQIIRDNLSVDKDAFDEPLMGTKLDKGGYMLLNGHHRWMAALSVEVPKGHAVFKKYVNPKVPLKVVNVTVEEDIYKVVNKSNRHKCVTIDLDEVLLVDKQMKGLLGRVYKANLRDNASLLVREMHRMGFDVWAYTGSYLSEIYIRGLFKINKCNVDGVVNGVNGKGKSVKLRDIFRSKYKSIAHVDNSAITIVDTETRDYEILDIQADNDGWAAAVVEKITHFEKEK